MIMKTLHTIYTSFAKRLVISLMVLMTVGVGTVLGAEELAYTIVFSNGANGNSEIKTTTQASTVIASDSRKYVTTSPFSAISKAYYGDTKTSIRLGTSSAEGALTIALSSDGQVSATKIVVSCGYWKSGENPTLSINSLASQSISSPEQDLTFNVKKDITSLSLNTSKRAYIYSISVYTEASAPTYAVTWKNGGHGTAPTSPTSASEVTLPTLSATGYTHTGWKADVDVKKGSNTISAGTPIDNNTVVTLSQATTFTAQWSAKTYTVNFTASPNGYGTVSQSSIANVPYGTTVTGNSNAITINGTIVTATPAAKDANYSYSFNNWSNVPNTITGTCTITANFTRTERELTNYRTTCSTQATVSFDLKGGDGIFEDVTLDGTTYVIPETEPTRNGYNFAGWKIQDGDNTVYKYGTTNSTINNITESITLVAQWSVIEYTITYHLNGGSGVENSTYTIESEDITLPTPTPEQQGLIFVGWYANADFTGQAVTKIISGSTGNKEFWAKWEKSTPTFAWSAASYTAALEADNTFPTLNNLNGLFVTYTSSNNGVATIDEDGNITLVATGTTTITAMGAETDTHKSATANYTLNVAAANCKWVETNTIEDGDEVVITMKGTNGVTYTFENTKNTTSAPSVVEVNNISGTYITNVVDRYKWVVNKDGDNLTFKSYSSNDYLYCINQNGDGVRVGNTSSSKIFIIDNESGYLKHKETSRYLGVYKYQDWRCYANKDNFAGQTLKFYKKTCLPADEYWINYNLSNVTCITNPIPSQIANDGEDLLLEFSANDGYKLPESISVSIGNNILPDDNDVYIWDSETGELLIFAAQVTDNITITIEGCEQLAAPTGLASSNLTSSSVTLSWNAVQNAESYTVYVTDGTNDITETTSECNVAISGLTKNTLYTWDVIATADGFCENEHSQEWIEFTTLDVFSVTFNNQGKGSAPAPQNVDAGGRATEPTVPTTTGYTFSGWYTESACTNLFDFNTVITKNTTLYAKWTEWSYTITYAKGSPADEITGEHAPGTKMYTSAVTIADESFYRKGYKQTGWSKTDGGQKDYDLLGIYGTNENVTLYPYWTKLHTITWMADGSAYDEATYLDGKTLALPKTDPEACQGSEFVGWTAEQNYSHATDAPDYITAGSAVNADDTYYAVYAEEIGEDEITLTIGAETDNTNGNAIYAYAIEVEGFSLVANKGAGQTSPTFNESNNDARIYAKGSITLTAPKNLTSIVFNLSTQGKKRLAPISASVGAIATQASGDKVVVWTGNASEVTFTVGEKANYGSDGSSNAGQLCFENIVVTSESSYTNYSTSCIPTYHVNYELAGGENGCADEGVKVGNDYTICNEEPTKTGYTFQHWTDGTNTYEAGETIENVQSNITLTAVWEANIYEITWMSNGEEYVTTTHTYDQPLELPSDPYTCYGTKTFMGWTETPSVNENGEGITYIEESTNPSEDQTYYAVFADEVVGEPEEVKATLSFANKAQRTSFSSDQQVWEQNGITLTNTQGNADNDAPVADYVNPARFYANSSISIQAPGNITEIVFACSSDSYVTPTKNSVGNSAKSDGNNVIVALSPSSNTFDIAKVTAQIRLNSLTVTYQSTPETTHSNYTTSPSGCPEIEVAENAYVTSTSGQSVKVKVPVTINNFQDGITLSASIEGESNFTVANISSITEGTATLEIAYKPTDYNITENTTVTVLSKFGENKVTATDFTITGRSLPKNFVIATKVGATWYALPANMNGATNPEGVVIDVDETNMTAIAPNTTVYTLFPVATVNGGSDRYNEYGERLRFAAVNNGNRGLWANDAKSGTTINNDAAITAANSTAGAAYEWKITTTIVDGNWQYTLQTDQTNNQKYLRYYNSKWGTYANGENGLYFLPVTEVEPFEMQVVEWYPTKLLVQTEATLATVSATIGSEDVEEPVVTQKGGKLYEISGLSLENNPTKLLAISYTADEITYANNTVIPIIISRAEKNIADEPFATLTADVYNSANLVVRDGAVLTVNGTEKANTFANVTIYPTAKISVPEKNRNENNNKLTVHSLTFFGGIDEIYDGSTYTINKYGVPQLLLKGILNKTVTTIDYIMRVDLDQMYSLTVPYDVQLADIKYWDGSDIALGSALYISAYDGEARANQSKKTWIYETDFESRLGAATLKAGVGYTISAELQAGVGNEYSILRMPMMSNVASGATETAKTVAVTAHGIDANVTDNHKGWNLVGNPYMTTITGADDADLVLGYLQETGSGPWEWVEKTYRYVTIPSDDGTYYWQQKFTTAELPPFKNFFVQIGTTGELAFGLGTRQSMPARSTQAAIEKEVEFEILMSNATRQDNTGLLISEEYSPAYEINADLEKMIGSMSVYTIFGGYKLAYNALSPINASEWIPMGYIAPAAGEYTFSLDDVENIAEQVEHVYIIDYNANNIVDLMDEEYKFTTDKEQNDNRFAINVVLSQDKDNTTTGLDMIQGNNAAPIKFIHQDKMYIYNDGIIYDATGKQVTNINK